MKILYQFVILMILIGFILIFSTCISPSKGRIDETSFNSHYDYRLLIQPSTPIYNVTLFIPLPIQNGTPKIGNLYLIRDTFKNERFLRSPLPPQSNYRFNIEEADGVPFLKITADTINSDQEYQFVYGERVISPPFTYLVNTRYPLGNESLFQPKFNLSENLHIPSELNYTTVIFADYKMEGSGTLFIMEGLSATNSWYLTSDASIGNDYTDDISLRIYDESHGRQKVKGSMTIGTGTYLD
jgi:hypothetical protein